MANHLKTAAIQTLLGLKAGQLRPGDVDDLIDALNRVNSKMGPDRDRSGEPTLGALFTATLQP